MYIVIPEGSDPTSLTQVTIIWTCLWLQDSACLSEGMKSTIASKGLQQKHCCLFIIMFL